MNYFLFLLVISSYFFNALILKRLKKVGTINAFIWSAGILGFYLWFLFELLSFFSVLNIFYVSWGFFAYLVVQLIGVFLTTKHGPLVPLHLEIHSLVPPFFRSNRFFSFSNFLFSSILFILFFTLIIALIAPPNNWDSMTYHMSRVVHWQQNQSLDFYPTNIYRQLASFPFAEMLILLSVMIGDGDVFANLVQWSALFLLVLMGIATARLLKLPKNLLLLPSFFVVTIPMVILQSTTTQNDLLASCWLMGFVLCCLQEHFNNHLNDRYDHYNHSGCANNSYVEKNNWVWQRTAMAGIFLGLAILSKATIYTCALPFVFYYVLLFFRPPFSFNYFIKHICTRMFLFSLIVLVINLPHGIRNYYAFSNFLGSSKIVNEHRVVAPSMNKTVSNGVKQLGMHLITPWEKVNSVITKAVISFHDNVLKIDVNSADITFNDTKFSLHRLIAHEDLIGNFWHTLLVFILLITTIFEILLILTKRKAIDRNYYIHVLLVTLVTLSGILFITLIKWQPWISRLHVPIFVLASIPLSIFFAKVSPRLLKVTVVILFVSTLPWIFGQKGRPILKMKNIFNTPRQELYFANRTELYKPYLDAINIIKDKNCHSVALAIQEDDYEYPLWALLKNQKFLATFHHFGISNDTKFIPEIVSDSTCLSLLIDKPGFGHYSHYSNDNDKDIDLLRISISSEKFLVLRNTENVLLGTTK
ncbi:MAG: hypothetical protein HQK53_04085 [Oligoflexia bacterium]|nr:hypothetical protein [Oligoflexia bacterium]